MTKKQQTAVLTYLESKNASEFARNLGYKNQGAGSSAMIRLLLEYIGEIKGV